MSTWLLFVVIGQFLFSVVVLVDRFIVTKGVVSKPVVYTFYVSFLSIFAIVALPFGVTIPTPAALLISIIAAMSYAISILFLYQSLRGANASEVVPVVGGVSAISAFIASSFLLNEQLPGHFLLGFTILVAGMLLISHFKFTARSLLFLSGSGVFFGLSTVVTKLLLQNETFINGFFWSRMANVVVALCFLLIPSVFKSIREDFLHSRKEKHHTHPTTGHKTNKIVLIVGNKILAAMGFICTLIALKSGNTTIVNALSATQYIFLLIFAIFFGRLMPEYFEETVHKHEFLHKTLATGLIVIGFIILFI